jgi:MFS family permease
VVEPIAIPKRTNTPAQVLFPTEPTLALLASLATFGIAFLARPIGSALFGHFGDRVGRKGRHHGNTTFGNHGRR